MIIDPIHKLHREFQMGSGDHGRIQTVCLQNTNPNGHADTLWSQSIIPEMGSGWGRRNNIIHLFIHQGSDQQRFNVSFFNRHRRHRVGIGNKSKNQGVIGNGDKINFRKNSSRRKTAGVFIEREIKCGDKKWSKKEIANKDMNKISFGQQGHAQTTANRSKSKISSHKVPTSRFAILRTIQIGAPNVCMLCKGDWCTQRDRGNKRDREYMETPRRTQKQKRKTITE